MGRDLYREAYNFMRNKNDKDLNSFGDNVDSLVEFTKEKLNQILDELFEEAKHGDEEHQNWLKEKFEEIKSKYN